MRIALWLPVWAGLIATNLSASLIEYSTTDVNANLFRVAYSVSGASFTTDPTALPQYRQLDIRFDPTSVSALSNPLVPNGFAPLILQPNNPPGVFGDFVIMVLTGDLSHIGPFSVDIVSTAQGPLGPQPFFINQFDANGNFLFTLDAGFTASADTAPEPSVFPLVAIGLLAGGAWWRVRKPTVSTRCGQ